jgi:twitching motility protein PilT
MKDGNTEGMQPFDLEFERLVRSGAIAKEDALLYATNPSNLALELADLDYDSAGPALDEAATGGGEEWAVGEDVG